MQKRKDFKDTANEIKNHETQDGHMGCILDDKGSFVCMY